MGKIRYVQRVNSTRHTEAALPHIDRLGKISKVRGYRVQIDQKGLQCKEEYVMVYGEHGTARFFATWGYSGDGPRTLAKLLEKCGFHKDTAELIARRSPRFDSVGDDWSVEVKPGENVGEGDELSHTIHYRPNGEVGFAEAA